MRTTSRATLVLGLCALCAAAACRGDAAGTHAAPASESAGGAGGSAPAGQRCLPAMICDQWAGCALIARDAQGAWSVIAADRLKPGEPVRVENACTTGASCEAAKAAPRDVACPPTETPPIISPPDYACVWERGSCASRKRP
jgi:hypothetical protein